MNKATKTLLTGLFVGIIASTFTMYLVMSDRPQASLEHQTIINKLVVVDVNYNSYLVPELVESVKSIPLAVVTTGTAYQHSVWIWYTFEALGYTGKDANLAMEVWGPLADGVYQVGFAKLAANTLTVYYDGEQVVELNGGVAQASIEVGSDFSLVIS